MNKLEHYSEGEQTIIFDPNHDEHSGIIIRGNQVTHILCTPFASQPKEPIEKTLQKWLADVDANPQHWENHMPGIDKEPYRRNFFILHTHGGNDAIAVPCLTVDIPRRHLTVAEAIAGNDTHKAYALSDAVIREMKSYLKTYETATRDEDIQQIRPDAPKRNNDMGGHVQ